MDGDTGSRNSEIEEGKAMDLNLRRSGTNGGFHRIRHAPMAPSKSSSEPPLLRPWNACEICEPPDHQ